MLRNECFCSFCYINILYILYDGFHIFTKWLCRGHAGSYEVEPEVKLQSANFYFVIQADDNYVQAVRIANEMVIDTVIRFIARKLPYAYFASICLKDRSLQQMVSNWKYAVTTDPVLSHSHYQCQHII